MQPAVLFVTTLTLVLAGLALIAPSERAQAATDGPQDYVALSPVRVADTRNGTGVRQGIVGAGQVLQVPVASTNGVPGDARAVWLNVTVTQPANGGFVTAYPCGAARPLASSLNFVAGETIANAVAVSVGSSGRVCLYASTTLHLVADLNGYFPADSTFESFNPARIVDTRNGTGGRQGPVGAGQVIAIPVTGGTGVPADAAAVSLNVTATQPETQGYFTLFPCGQSRPGASSLNFVAQQTIPNAVIAKVGSNATVCLYSSTKAHAVVDLNGYFPDSSSYSPVTPLRAADTRDGTGVREGIVPAGRSLEVPIAGRSGIPADAAATAVNVTATQPRTQGYLTVYPCGSARPVASTLNFSAGQTIANAALAKVGTGGSICIYVSTTMHVVADVNGYYPAPGPIDTTPPGPVTGLSITEATGSSISLAWGNPAAADLAEVLVRRASGATAPQTPTAGTAVPLSSPTATSVRDAGLATGSTYSYAVFARDEAGNISSTAATVSGSTVDNTPPGPVTGLAVRSATASTVTLGWQNPADSDLAELLVRRASGTLPPSSPSAGTAVPLPTPTTDSVIDEGLAPDTDYSYAIFTRDSSGNTTTTSATVVARTLPALRGSQITAGFGHTCAIDTAGALWCWGRNTSGQLGDGTTSTRLAPVAVSGGRTYRSVTGGGLHTCAVDLGGAAWCWGYNAYGQVGDGTTITRTAPVAVAGGDAYTTISAGLHHSCGLGVDTTPRCWGRNSSGQLGDGSTTNRSAPVTAGGSYRAITTGASHTCAIDTAGAGWCWGANALGQLGDGTASLLRSTPVAVAGGLVLESLDGGGEHTCAIDADGAAWCWGLNRNGQIGDGSTAATRTSPARVANGSYRTLAAGTNHTCAIDTAQAAWCWGWNAKGQLGDGSTSDRTTPVAVTRTR